MNRIYSRFVDVEITDRGLVEAAKVNFGSTMVPKFTESDTNLDS